MKIFFPWRNRWRLLGIGLVSATGAVGGPSPDSPLRLLDLRALARPTTNAFFLVDAWHGERPEPVSDDAGFVLADVAGPGVVHHWMADGVGHWTIEVDGVVVLDGDAADWRHLALHVAQSGPGDVPWAWPLAMRTPNSLHAIVPIPFERRLRVRNTRPAARLWLAGERLDAPPPRRFGDPRWTGEVEAAQSFHSTVSEDPRRAPPLYGWQGLVPQPDSESRVFEAFPGPGERVTLMRLDGAGEILGLRFEFRLPFFNRLRDLVAEIYTDGADAPRVRLPLMDLLGNTHPFFRLWNLTHGTWAVGLQHPAGHEPWLTGWFRLPIPYAEGLRFDLINRHPDLQQHVAVRARIAPLTSESAARAMRLCGMRMRGPLPEMEGETADLFRFAQPGRLAMLTVFPTGHRQRGPWTATAHLRLVDDADRIVTAGFPFFPLAGSPFHPRPINLTWSQTQYGADTWLGGSRVFWVDPLPLAPGTRIQYVGGGSGGPDQVEAAVLWYQAAPFVAPPVEERASVLPTRWIEFLPARAPGGVAVEAEEWIDRTVATDGDVFLDRGLALDAQASGDAFLGWNAPATGAALDLFVVTPPTPYVEVWVRACGVPDGGRFGLRLVPAGRSQVDPPWDAADRDFAAHRMGHLPAPALVNSYSPYPLQRLLRHQTRVWLRNPLPEGDLARLRFVSLNTGGGARLALDQITINPAPALPPGWHRVEPVGALMGDPGLHGAPMIVGRDDFYGRGGWRITASAPGRIVLVLHDPVPRPADDRTALRLRGWIEHGEWSAALDGAEPVALSNDGKAPGTWELRSAAANPSQKVVLTTPGRNAMIVLDSWKTTPVD